MPDRPEFAKAHGQEPHRLKEIAGELRSARQGESPEPPGRRPLMQPLSFYPTSSTLGDQVACRPAQSREIDVLVAERTELLVRKHSGQELSAAEQQRLAMLTERLDSLLPSVSPADRERLKEMEAQTERIREEAKLRRQRLGLA